MTRNTPSKATPVHDAMVAWTHSMVEDPQQLLLKELLGSRLPGPGQYVADRDLIPKLESRILDRIQFAVEHDRGEEHARLRTVWDQNRAFLSGHAPIPDPQLEVDSVTWESPIDNGRGSIVGYVDLLVEVSWTRPILHATGSMFGPIEDFLLRWDSDWRGEVLYFEVKPEIPSVGELLRQINKYRHYRKDGIWVVICPDGRFTNVLGSQDVRLVTPAPGQQQTLALLDGLT